MKWHLDNAQDFLARRWTCLNQVLFSCSPLWRCLAAGLCMVVLEFPVHFAFQINYFSKEWLEPGGSSSLQAHLNKMWKHFQLFSFPWHRAENTLLVWFSNCVPLVLCTCIVLLLEQAKLLCYIEINVPVLNGGQEILFFWGTVMV